MYLIVTIKYSFNIYLVGEFEGARSSREQKHGKNNLNELSTFSVTRKFLLTSSSWFY